MVPDSKISKYAESEFKSKIEKLFMNEKVLEGCSVRICKIYLYFYEHDKEKIKVDKNRCKYILFRIDVYFTRFFLTAEIDEQNLKTDILFLSTKDKRN